MCQNWVPGSSYEWNGNKMKYMDLLNKIQKPRLSEINHWLQSRLVRTRQPEPDQMSFLEQELKSYLLGPAPTGTGDYCIGSIFKKKFYLIRTGFTFIR